MSKRIWILGAADPEMQAIETLLRECGECVVYAVDERGERATPATAYRAVGTRAPSAEHWYGGDDGAAWGVTDEGYPTVYTVECCVDPGTSGYGAGSVRIDHHRPGDPGYGRPPSDFLAASSLGQVLRELARLGAIPSSWRRMSAGWAAPLTPQYADGAPVDYTGASWLRVGRGGKDAWDIVLDAHTFARVPRELVLAAAADHCLGAAYRGECPGVDPDALMRWRAESRAKHQKRTVREVLADVERARHAVREAPLVSLGFAPDAPGCAHHRGYAVPDCGDCDYEGGALTVHDLRGCAVCGGFGGATGADEGHGYDPSTPCHHGPFGVPELPEAAAREGAAYLATVIERDGRAKIVLGGHTTPAMVRAFLDTWAPSQGLTGIYGDPARGFAGGYLP